MRVNDPDVASLVIVDGAIDAADDWIAEQCQAGDIVITADIALASRALAKGAAAIGTTGVPFTEDNIGDALATLQCFGGGLVADRDNLVAACRRALARKDASVAVPALLAAWKALEFRGPFEAACALGEEVAHLALGHLGLVTPEVGETGRVGHGFVVLVGQRRGEPIGVQVADGTLEPDVEEIGQLGVHDVVVVRRIEHHGVVEAPGTVRVGDAVTVR